MRSLVAVVLVGQASSLASKAYDMEAAGVEAVAKPV